MTWVEVSPSWFDRQQRSDKSGDLTKNQSVRRSDSSLSFKRLISWDCWFEVRIKLKCLYKIFCLCKSLVKLRSAARRVKLEFGHYSGGNWVFISVPWSRAQTRDESGFVQFCILCWCQTYNGQKLDLHNCPKPDSSLVWAPASGNECLNQISVFTVYGRNSTHYSTVYIVHKPSAYSQLAAPNMI
jgi:hypothetical protein